MGVALPCLSYVENNHTHLWQKECLAYGGKPLYGGPEFLPEYFRIKNEHNLKPFPIWFKPRLAVTLFFRKQKGSLHVFPNCMI